MANESLSKPIHVNGINGSTGESLLPRISDKNRLVTWLDLLNHVSHDEEDDLSKLTKARMKQNENKFGVKAGVDAKRLEEAGWGVIYAKNITSEIKKALSPLIHWRRDQANKKKELFKEYIFWKEDEDRQPEYPEFMRDHDTGPRDDADPEEMPYYLLLVGDPVEIPYTFQYALDVNRAIGRIHFETVQEYANYANSVVSAERDGIRLPKRAAFWSVTNENDPATQLSTEHLIKPLHSHFSQELGNQWQLDAYLGQDASKTQLQALLGGDKQKTPAFLMTGSHGMGFNFDDPRLAPHHGALLGSEWGGESGRISEDKYMAGEHLDNAAQLHGLIAFFFACYGAGIPEYDDFMGKVEGTAKQIAPRPLLSKLPQRMLSHPRGGSLAVIGHVDRAWTFSFMEDSSNKTSTSRLAFESTLTALFKGAPIGHALDYFNRKHASSSVNLIHLLDQQRRGANVDDYDLIDTWITNHDARDYVIFGDPAVRLCVDLENETVKASTLALKEINLDTYKVNSTSLSTMTLSEVSEPSTSVRKSAGTDFPTNPETETQRDLSSLPVGTTLNARHIQFAGKEILVAEYVVASPNGKHTQTVELDPNTLKPVRPLRIIGEGRGAGGAAFPMGVMDRGLGQTLQDAIDRFSDQVSNAMHNVSTLEVLTYTSSDALDNVYDNKNKRFNEQAQLKAATLLSLNGSIQNMVPVREVTGGSAENTPTKIEIDSELLNIHKEMVVLAQENQARFFKNILEVTTALVNMRK